MSKDADPHQRLWLFLGYGGKRAPKSTWRWWKKTGAERTWIISAPNALAEFEQRGTAIFYHGEKVYEGKTQWDATWNALAYFYKNITQTTPKPPVE